MDEFAAPIAALIDSLNKKCPKFKPAIIPSKYSFKQIDDLFSSTILKKNETNEWISSLTYSQPQVSFTTEIDYAQRMTQITEIKFVSELDWLLNNPEKVISLLVQGGEAEISIAVARFLELNEYNPSIADGRNIFNEVYNGAYALRVLLSNIPNFRVVIGKTSVPVNDESVSVESLFAEVMYKEKKSKAKLLSSQSVSEVQSKEVVSTQPAAEEEEDKDDQKHSEIAQHSGKNKKRRRAK